MFNREIFFDIVREDLFGPLDQQQVDGMNDILTVWEKYRDGYDLRWLAYMLATTMHESASTMQPIEEYGHGKGMEYGKPHPVTGETYYGRGFVQTTWYDNYVRADKEIAAQFPGIVTDCEHDASQQLDPRVAAATMFLGMEQGWFRTSDGKPETLERYFNDDTDDPFMAREIINGDKTKVPSWSNGAKIGDLIARYHDDFLGALVESKEPSDATS